MATTKAFELAQLSAGVTSTTGVASLADALNVNGTEILVGTNDSRFAENNLRFMATGASYIDVNTVGQSLNFRVSDTSSLDTTPLIIASDGKVTLPTLTGEVAIDTGSLTLDGGRNVQWGGAYGSGFPAMWGHSANKQIKFAPDGNTSGLLYQMTATQLEVNPTTASTSTSTGALVVGGGAGIAENLYVGGNTVISGNLTVEGTNVSLNTTDLNVEDKNITLNYHASNDTSASAGGAGITIQDAVDASTDATILWDDTNDEFDFSHTVNVTGNLVSDGLTVDGNSTFNTAGTLFANLNYGGANKGRFTTDGIDIKIEATSNLQLIANSVLSAKINGTGDISFYEDNGGTPQVGMHWDYTDGYLGIGDTAPEAPLFVNGNESTITDLTPVLWARSKTGASITQMNVKGDQIQFGGGATLDTSPAMTIDYGSNNVGIGTTNPSTALHVDPGYVTLGTSSGTDNSWINNVEDGNLELVNEGRSTNDGAVRINRKNNPAGDTTYFRDTVIYDGKSNVVLFVDGSEGEVGIGTSAPQSKLETNLHSGADSSLMNANTVNDVHLIRAGFGSSPATTSNAGAKWGLRFVGRNDGTYDNQKSGAIYAVSEDSGAGYNREVGLAFHVSNFDNAHAEAMRIDNDGNVGIGTNDPNANGTKRTLHISNTASGAAIRLTQSDNALIRYDDTSGLQIGTLATKDFILETADVTAVTISGDNQNVNFVHIPSTDEVRHTIRPSLNIDFANSKTLHPRMTFSRRSGATYYDEDGILRYASNNVPRFNHDPETGESLGLLIEYDATNIIPSSEHFSLFSTSRAEIIKNRALAPDDTMSAIQIGSDTAATSRVIHDFSLFSPAASSTYTVSCYAKASGSTVFSMELGAGANNGQSAFDLSAGTASTPTFGGTVSNAVSYIQPIRNGWYRCILVVTHSSSWSGTTNVAFYDQTNFNDNGTKKEGILVWGPQIESGTFATSYTPSYTEFNSRSSRATYFDKTGTLKQASEDVLREGYLFDGRSFKPTGPIIEPARTNYFKYSSTSNCWYNGQTATQSYGYPDIAGSNHSTKVGSSLTGYSITNSLTANTHYCYSVFVKNINASSVGFYVDASFGTGFSHTFSTSTWNTSVNNTNVLADGVQNYGNGWYRIYATFVTDSDGGVAAPRVQAGGGEAYFCFPQIEEGHTPTSYIHNYGSTATRAADVHNSYQSVPRRSDICEMLDVEDLIPQPTGTVFTEWNYAEPAGGFAGIFEIRDEGTVGIDHRVASNVVQYYVSNSSINLGGYPTPVVPSTTDPRNEYQKTALAYDFDSRLDHQTFRNGVLQSSNTSSTTDMYLKDIRLGSIDFNPAYQLNGHIKSFKLYPSRIDNAHGVALTENN